MAEATTAKKGGIFSSKLFWIAIAVAIILYFYFKQKNAPADTTTDANAGGKVADANADGTQDGSTQDDGSQDGTTQDDSSQGDGSQDDGSGGGDSGSGGGGGGSGSGSGVGSGMPPIYPYPPIYSVHTTPLIPVRYGNINADTIVSAPPPSSTILSAGQTGGGRTTTSGSVQSGGGFLSGIIDTLFGSGTQPTPKTKSATRKPPISVHPRPKVSTQAKKKKSIPRFSPSSFYPTSSDFYHM